MPWQLKRQRYQEKSPSKRWRYSCRLHQELHGRICPVSESRTDPYWRFMSDDNSEIQQDARSLYDEGDGFVKYRMLHSPFPWPWSWNKHMALH